MINNLMYSTKITIITKKTNKMKILETNILVFSPTGSGLKVAKHIRDNIGIDTSILSDVTYPRNRVKSEMVAKSNTLTIIVFPIHADSLPDIFFDFISKYNFNYTPVILIAGYGNIFTGKALIELRNIAIKNNAIVISAANIVFPHSYNGDKLQIGPNRPTKEELNHITKFIDDSIQKITDFEFSELPQVSLPKGYKRLITRIPNKFLVHIFIKRPDVDLTRCNKCNVCIKTCPSGAMLDNLKINNSLCIRCLACIKYCKNKARSFSTRTDLLVNTLKKESRAYHQNEYYI
jgi:ferredoxin